MGNASSTGEGGFRVLRIHPGTPAEAAGLQPFFDFLVGVDSETISSPDVSLQSVIRRVQSSNGVPIKLTVFNTLRGAYRDVFIDPARPESSSPLLGVSLAYQPFDEALRHPLRILRVQENSPASAGALTENSDYILGDDTGPYRSAADLRVAAEERIGETLSLWVYNRDTQTIRRVCLSPSNTWGGLGCLGVDLGSGGLHRLRPLPETPVGYRSSSIASGESPAAGDLGEQQQQQHGATDVSLGGEQHGGDRPRLLPLEETDPDLEVADPRAASCLLLPLTNSPLRDPHFVGSSFKAAAERGSETSSVGLPQQENGDSGVWEQLLQRRHEALGDNIKSAFLAYDLPFLSAVEARSSAVIEGSPLPGEVSVGLS